MVALRRGEAFSEKVMRRPHQVKLKALARVVTSKQTRVTARASSMRPTQPVWKSLMAPRISMGRGDE